MEKGKRAIVIGEEHYNTLGVIRSLGEGGIECYFIDTGINCYYVKHSKYIQKYFKCNDLDPLLKLVNDLSKDNDAECAIFPTNDKIAEYIDRNLKNLKGFIVPNACGKLYTLLDKQKMNNLAKSTGILVPKEEMYRLSENIEKNLEKWKCYPCIIKPNISMYGSKSDITIANNIEELKDKIYILENKGYQELLVQEYIDDSDKRTLEIMGYSINGEIKYQSPPIIKVREYPKNNGSTSYAKFSTNEIISNYIQSIKDMVQSTNYTGLFDLEFILIKKKLYFIEMNFRNGAPAYALTNSGINLPEKWYNEMKREYVINVESAVNGRLMAEHLDIRHVRNKEISFVKWFKDFCTCEHRLLLNKKDWKPVIYFIVYKILRKM